MARLGIFFSSDSVSREPLSLFRHHGHSEFDSIVSL